MKFLTGLVLLLLLNSCGLVLAQAESNFYSIGKIIKIKSKVLNEERKIYVYLPKEYDSTNENYPVLYVLNSELNFNHAVGTESYLAETQIIPKLIVVGIDIKNINLDLNEIDHSAADKFLSFIKDELQQYINANYRTQPFNILFSHSVTGAFAFYILLKQPEIFNSFIISSPYDKDKFNYLSSLAEEALPAKYERPKFLLIMVGNDPYFSESISKLTEVINKKAGGNLLWYYTMLDNESYSYSALITLYNGLQFTYGDYKVPSTMSAAGNLDTLKTYFKKLSLDYGYDLKIPERLLTEFGFQVLNAQRLNDAIDVFKYEAEAFPNSPASYGYLGLALEQNNNLAEAEKNYSIAYEKSVEQNSTLVEYYKSQLEKIKMKSGR